MIEECKACEDRRIWWARFREEMAVYCIGMACIVLLIVSGIDRESHRKALAEKDAELAVATKEIDLKRSDLMKLVEKYNKLLKRNEAQQETIDNWECRLPLSPTPLKESNGN